jgi:hypothetical protein
MLPDAWRRISRAHRLRGLVLVLGTVAVCLLWSCASNPSAEPAATARAGGGGSENFGAFGSVPAVTVPPLTLSTVEAPTPICAFGENSCSAGVGSGRVELQAQATQSPSFTWPAVQVVFVIDTTSYAGDYGPDSAGLDPCANAGNGAGPCEESNGIPFFVANAQLIASEIQSANPHSAVSFALVDYYDAWGSGWDDADGPEYHVDIGQFIPSNEFGSAVTSTFQQVVLGGGWDNWDQDMDNNFLDSSSITALYGAIVGSDLNWSDGAHHVVVWMGVTAPRAPGYQQNYCVSASAWLQWGQPPSCYSQACEPSYSFADGSSPNCEGWVRSQDGNSTHSIAALARTAPACIHSAGGSCTIDAIDLWTTSTDPYSKGWPTGLAAPGGGPGGTMVQQNVNRVLAAGCDLSEATGGTWMGPAWYSCSNGVTGGLEYVAHGTITNPNKNNPTLLAAFRSIGFGPVTLNEVARGTDQPFFLFVPWGNIEVAPFPQWAASCATPAGFTADCPRTPSVIHWGSSNGYGWNWSSNASRNAMYIGDVWTASFNVRAIGPPFGRAVPVDACFTLECRYAGSGAVGGVYTWANYWAFRNTTQLTQSFPLAELTVETPPVIGSAPGPPLGTPPPPGLPIVGGVPVSIGNPSLVALQTPIGSVTGQAIAAGLLGAGFTRIGLKQKAIPMAVAAVQGKAGALGRTRSRFE